MRLIITKNAEKLPRYQLIALVSEMVNMAIAYGAPEDLEMKIS